MLDHVLKGEGEIMYNTAYHPVLGNGIQPPVGSEDWEELYGFDVEAAKELMAQAGYGPDNPSALHLLQLLLGGRAGNGGDAGGPD